MSPIFTAKDGVLYVDGERMDQYLNRSLSDLDRALERAFADATEGFKRMGIAMKQLDLDETKLPKTSSKGHWRDVVPRRVRGRKED